MKKAKLIYAILVVLLFSIAPYLIFKCYKPENSQEWGAIGDYFTGVSSLLNVIVFIVITFLIHGIDSRNKKRELDFNQRKEVFARFLSAFEDLVTSLYSLKVYLAVSVFSSDVIDIDPILSSYKSIKATCAYAATYIVDNNADEQTTSDKNIISSLNTFLDEQVFQLIETIRDNSSKLEDIKVKIAAINKNIEGLILDISDETKKYIGSGCLNE